MPVTVIPASHAARPFPKIFPATSKHTLLRLACPNECTKDTEILISSFEHLKRKDDIVPSSGSFLRGAMQAWAHHLHLVLRPEDIWFTILVQLNFYMSANAEHVRHLFVDHQGKEETLLMTEVMNAESLKELLGQFSAVLNTRIKTTWMLDWIMPDFTTTTEDDKMTANILMMGILQSYYSYWACESCGIPSITLLGEREDWAKLANKVDRLAEFGAEPTEYAARLKPILIRFVRTFDEPHSADIRSFWNCIVKANPSGESGGPPYEVSGWLMGFCYWNSMGEPKFAQPWLKQASAYELMQLDGVAYPIVGNTDVPVGYAKASCKIADWPGHDGGKFPERREFLPAVVPAEALGGKFPERKKFFPGVVLAGALGKRITPGAPKGYGVALQQLRDYETAAAKSTASSTGKVSSKGCLSFAFPTFRARKSNKVDRKQAKKSTVDTQLNGQQQASTSGPPLNGKDSNTPNKPSQAVPLHEQGTLQPVSGWIVFGPEKEQTSVGPDEELDVLQSYFKEDARWRKEQMNATKLVN